MGNGMWWGLHRTRTRAPRPAHVPARPAVAVTAARYADERRAAPRVLALRDRRSRGISLLLCSLGASATGCEARAGKSGMWPVPLRTPTCRVLLGRSSGAPNSSRKLASGTDRIGGQVRARAVFAAGENVKNGRQAHLGMQQHLEGYLSRIKERILRPQY